MRKTIGRITVFAVLFMTFAIGIFLVAIWTVDDAVHYVPMLHVDDSGFAKIGATAIYVADVETGKEIFSKNKETILPIASVTKLFTAAIFYKGTPLEATTSITWKDLESEGRAGKFEYGQVYSYRELMYPLLLESSNDAAGTMLKVAPELPTAMNTYVHDKGFMQTQFADTSGLSPKNISTAEELSYLSQILYREYPHIFDITRLTQFIGATNGWRNNNPLVFEDGYRGGKHGFTYEANRTDVAFFEETIVTGQKRMVSYVILGSTDIKSDIALLRKQVQQNVRLE